MKIDENNFEMTAKTLFGLEGVLAEELKEIGAEEIMPLTRAVSFRGSKETMYRANLELRTALRIYKPIHKFRVRDENELYSRTKELHWEEYLNTETTFAIDSTVHSENFNHENYVALKVKDALADRMRQRFGARPDVDVVNPDIRFHVHIKAEDCMISLDSSGNSLHKRGYRIGQIKAPMNEVLAAGMIKLSGWNADCDFIDAMCGSGTIAMEAATIAYNIAPGIKINSFGFMKWKDWDPALWAKLVKKAKSREREFKHNIIGFDESPKAIQITKYNVKNADLGWKISLKTKKFENLTHDDLGAGGLVIINPPYGERLDDEDISVLYKAIGDSLKQNFDGYCVWIISSNMEALKNIGLRTSRRLTLYNGALECKFLNYEIYQGTRKKKWLELNKENEIIPPSE